MSGHSLAAAAEMRVAWQPEYYAPLIGRAIDVGTPIVAANLSREAARKVMRDGFAALGAGRARELALDQAWDANREERLRREIIAGHCGHVQDDLLPRLVAAQRARDALMADVLLGHITGGAVGIVGRGHARRDIGVPAIWSSASRH